MDFSPNPLYQLKRYRRRFGNPSIALGLVVSNPSPSSENTEPQNLSRNQEFASLISAAPATHSCVRPSSPSGARMARKSRVFAHSILSLDSWLADLEVEIAESLRPRPGPKLLAFRAAKAHPGACLDQTVAASSRPGRGANLGSTSADHKAFSFGSVESSRSGSSRLGISGIALPAIACRSPTIPTVESTTARI
jgi:hypothetical protein